MLAVASVRAMGDVETPSGHRLRSSKPSSSDPPLTWYNGEKKLVVLKRIEAWSRIHTYGHVTVAQRPNPVDRISMAFQRRSCFSLSIMEVIVKGDTVLQTTNVNWSCRFTISAVKDVPIAVGGVNVDWGWRWVGMDFSAQHFQLLFWYLEQRSIEWTDT